MVIEEDKPWHCCVCRSTNLLFQATATQDGGEGDFVLQDVFTEEAFCFFCDADRAVTDDPTHV